MIRGYAGGDIVLPGDADAVIRAADNPELDRPARPHADHQRRHDAAGGRRQGGRGHHHGDGRLAHGASARSRHGPLRLCFTCDEEIGRGVDHLDPRPVGAAACYTLDGQGSDLIDVRDLLRRPGRGDRPRREHPSVDRQGTDDQRGAGGGPLSRSASPRSPLARDHRRPPGLPASLSNQRRRRRSQAARPPAGFPHGRPGRAGRVLREAADAVNREFPAGQIDVEHHAPVPQHGRGACAASRGRWPTPSGPWSGWAARRS